MCDVFPSVHCGMNTDDEEGTLECWGWTDLCVISLVSVCDHSLVTWILSCWCVFCLCVWGFFCNDAIFTSCCICSTSNITIGSGPFFMWHSFRLGWETAKGVCKEPTVYFLSTLLFLLAPVWHTLYCVYLCSSLICLRVRSLSACEPCDMPAGFKGHRSNGMSCRLALQLLG